MVAAVADWRVEAVLAEAQENRRPAELNFAPIRDILAELGASPERPRLLVGFAAETDDVVANADRQAHRQGRRLDRRQRRVGQTVMGGAHNRVHLVTAQGVEDWPEAAKEEVARHLVERIARELG